MGFWRGLRWGVFLGVIAALVGRIMSGEDNEAAWRQAKSAGDIAAAQTESEQRERYQQARAKGGDSEAPAS